MQNRTTMKRRDDAVSPVIGIMLMLVVTIIIAAVVSAYAGGMVTSQEATPSANFDVSLTDDSLSLDVRSISEEVSSKDISIVLSKAGQMRKLIPGASTVPFGFNIVGSRSELSRSDSGHQQCHSGLTSWSGRM